MKITRFSVLFQFTNYFFSGALLSLERTPNKGPVTWHCPFPQSADPKETPCHFAPVSYNSKGKAQKKNILSSTFHIIFGDTPLQFCWTHFSSRETLSKLSGRSVSSVFTLVDWIRIALRKSKDSFAFSFSIAPNRLPSHLLITNHIKIIILTAMNLNHHYVLGCVYVSSSHSISVGGYDDHFTDGVTESQTVSVTCLKSLTKEEAEPHNLAILHILCPLSFFLSLFFFFGFTYKRFHHTNLWLLKLRELRAAFASFFIPQKHISMPHYRVFVIKHFLFNISSDLAVP